MLVPVDISHVIWVLNQGAIPFQHEFYDNLPALDCMHAYLQHLV
jgi:hypothetical protein